MKTVDSFEKDNQSGENHSGLHPNTPVKYLTASSVIGDKIYSHLDEHLGEIKDLMMNIAKGTIDYVIIEFGGFLGIGKKYFAIPFHQMKIDADRHAFILNQTRAALESAPGFDKDHWPDTNFHPSSNETAWGGFMGPNTGSEYLLFHRSTMSELSCSLDFPSFF
jgi:sporulation protein YlmC with PRC-barrel domain